MKEVWVIADTPVRDEDKTGKIQAVDILFQTFSQGQVVQGVARESLNGNGNAVIIHEQPHLDDGKLAFFLAYAHLAEAFFQDTAFFVQNILIRFPDLKVEVSHIVINDLRRAVRFFNKVCVDTADDPVFIVGDEIQGIKDVIRIMGAKDRFKVILILA